MTYKEYTVCLTDDLKQIRLYKPEDILTIEEYEEYHILADNNEKLKAILYMINKCVAYKEDINIIKSLKQKDLDNIIKQWTNSINGETND